MSESRHDGAESADATENLPPVADSRDTAAAFAPASVGAQPPSTLPAGSGSTEEMTSPIEPATASAQPSPTGDEQAVPASADGDGVWAPVAAPAGAAAASAAPAAATSSARSGRRWFSRSSSRAAGSGRGAAGTRRPWYRRTWAAVAAALVVVGVSFGAGWATNEVIGHDDPSWGGRGGYSSHDGPMAPPDGGQMPGGQMPGGQMPGGSMGDGSGQSGQTTPDGGAGEDGTTDSGTSGGTGVLQDDSASTGSSS